MAKNWDFLIHSPKRPQSLVPRRAVRLGSEFDTDFSRTEGMRIARAGIFDTLLGPATRFVTSPTVHNKEGLKDLPTPVIIAANHQSHLDTPLILSILPPEIRHHCIVGAGADYFFDRRLRAYLSASFLGAIPIERSRPSRTSAELAYRLVGQGWNLVLFPEGGRTPDGLIQPLKAGAAQVALRTGTPVLPVYIDGTYEIFGKATGRLRPGKTTITVGRLILTGSATKPAELMSLVEQQLLQLGKETASDWWSARTTSPLTIQEHGWISAWNKNEHRHRSASARPWPQRFGSKKLANPDG